jgi:subtilisin family serine protease
LAVLICDYAASSISAQLVPNDTYYSQYQWYSPKIGEPQAWSISTGSPSVTVAILDTGVISYTPDLAGRILPALSAVAGQPPFTDAWMTDTTQTGLRRHGTWVASAVAMGINNGIGGTGVGNFSILPIRIADDAYNIGAQDSTIANGIRMAADNGAKVINISYLATDYSQLDSAAAYARSKGALTFIATGNSNGYFDLPTYSNLIFVSGTNESDQRWSQWTTDANGVDTLVGSTYGPFVDISAPASNILLADPTTIHGYGLNSGTSFAAPMVAGAAALAWSINPNLTPDQVEQMLYSTAVDLGDPGRDQVFGWGRLDIGAVAEAAYLTSVPEPAAWIMLVSVGIAAFLWHRRR